MDWGSFLQLLFGLAMAAAAAYLYWRVTRPKKSESSSGNSSNSFGDSSLNNASTAEKIESPKPDESDLAREIAYGGKAGALKEVLAELTGEDTSNQAGIEQALRQLPEHTLQALRLALGTKALVDLDMKSRRRRKPSLTPDRRMEQVRMRELDELVHSDPLTLAEDDDLMLMRFASGELTRPQWYRWVEELKAAEILIDVSPSMEEPTRDGLPKSVMAMAIAIQLLLEAQKGGAKYFIRTFDAKVQPLMRATTKDEAKALIKKIFEMSFSGSGTEILKAVRRAVKDMDEEIGQQLSSQSIVLVTDAQDELTVANLTKAIGPKCKLHSVVLGGESDPLKEVSTSYLSLK